MLLALVHLDRHLLCEIFKRMSKPTLYYALFSPPARACILIAKLIGLDVDLK